MDQIDFADLQCVSTVFVSIAVARNFAGPGVWSKRGWRREGLGLGAGHRTRSESEPESLLAQLAASRGRWTASETATVLHYSRSSRAPTLTSDCPSRRLTAVDRWARRRAPLFGPGGAMQSSHARALASCSASSACSGPCFVHCSSQSVTGRARESSKKTAAFAALFTPAALLITRLRTRPPLS